MKVRQVRFAVTIQKYARRFLVRKLMEVRLVYPCMHVCMYVCMYVWKHVMCMYVCMYVCICIVGTYSIH